jgi:hypothetical protein
VDHDPVPGQRIASSPNTGARLEPPHRSVTGGVAIAKKSERPTDRAPTRLYRTPAATVQGPRPGRYVRRLVASSSGRGTGGVASSLSPARSAHTYVRAPAGYAACRCKASGTLEKASEGLVAHTPTPRYTDSCMQCCKLAIRLAKRERRARALSDLSDHVSRARAVRRGRRGACVIMGVHCFDYDSNRPSSSEYVSAGVNSRMYLLGTKVQPQGTQSRSRCASLSPSHLWVPNSSSHHPLLSSVRCRRRHLGTFRMCC